MCNRNCKNCKYYEYQRTVDNEIHRCNCPEIFSSYEGIINDEEIVNDFSCKYYKAKSQHEIGDRVYVMRTEGKTSYVHILYCKGTIIDVTFEPIYNKTTYKVKIDDQINKYQEDGLFIFNRSKSLLNINQCENRIIKTEVKDMLLKPNKCEGEIRMNTNMCGHDAICAQQGILDLYHQKKSAQYSAETQEAIATIHANSVCGRAAKNYVNYLKKNGVNEKLIPDYRSLISVELLTPTEVKMIDELNDAYRTAMNNLNKKCQECTAILATCETFEQKMVVLQNYDIIDCLYKLK